MTFKPCVVIPIYNHRDTITRTVQALRPYGVRCFIVDDGSDPGTQGELRALASRHASVTVSRFDLNRGKGAAVMLGLQLAINEGYSHALQIDADEQHNTADVPRLLALAHGNPESLIAAQPAFNRTIPVIRRFTRWINHFWVGLETLSLRPPDTMCGFRVYPLSRTVELIKQVRLGQRMDFDIEIMVRLLWDGVPWLPCRTRVNYPHAGKSHFRYVRDNLLIGWMHTRLFFGMIRRFPVLLRRAIKSSSESDRHWSKTKERGAEIGIRILLVTYKLFGRKGYDLMLLPVMGYFFVTGHKARTASRTFLKRAFDAGSPHPDMKYKPTLRTSFKHFLAFGDSTIDTVTAWMGDLSDRDLVFGNRGEFTCLAASGKGAVIIGSHLGNMGVGRALAAPTAFEKLTVLMFTEHAENFNRVLKKLNPKVAKGVLYLDRVGADTALVLQRKIEGGGLLAILGDRTPLKTADHVSYADFLGRKAPFPQGPFILAGLLRCPVYLMFCLKVNKKYHVYFEQFEPRLSISRSRRQADLQPYVERYAARLEYYALKQPLQWFNFYDFWRKTGMESIGSSD